jgi:signal transduction histidine kinase
VELPGDGESRVATLVERDGTPVAALVHDVALADEPELVAAVCAAAGIALQNERLQADLRARLSELQESRARIVQAADAERKRLERNLHDGAQQRLVSVALALRVAGSRVEADPQSTRALLATATEELSLAMEELRELARGLHPAILTQRGLAPAVRLLAGRAAVPVAVGDLHEERLAEPVEAAAYYVVAEALTNVARYARAGEARVSVTLADGCAVVEVGDDGVGGADPTGGTGLRGLRDRVEALGGRLHVVSPLGGGTWVRAEIPLARPA